MRQKYHIKLKGNDPESISKAINNCANAVDGDAQREIRALKAIVSALEQRVVVLEAESTWRQP